jgi:hypothetical protein
MSTAGFRLDSGDRHVDCESALIASGRVGERVEEDG